MEMTSEGLKIFTLLMPLLAINILAGVGSHLKKFTCTTHCAVCQPEVSTAVDDLIWSDDSSSRLALSQAGAGANSKRVSEARWHIQFIT